MDSDEKAKRKQARSKKKYNETHKIIKNEIYKLCPLHKTYFENEDEWVMCDEEHFSKFNNSKMDGLYTYCKRCNNEKNKKRQKGLGQKALDYFKKRRVIMKEENAKYFKKYNSTHKEDAYIRSKKWRQDNPDKVKKNSKKYSNKLHIINKSEWNNCKDYFKNVDGEYCCIYCGMTEKEHKERYHQQLNKEHVLHNGANDLSNCVPSCKSCNSSKHEHELEEWYTKQDFFNQEKLNKIYRWLDFDYKLYIEEKKI